MQSAWSVGTSFPMPPRGEDPELEDENLKVTTETQRFEVLCYNSGLWYPDTLVMNRKGFEKLTQRAGWHVRLLRRFYDGSEEEEQSSDEEEEEEPGPAPPLPQIWDVSDDEEDPLLEGVEWI